MRSVAPGLEQSAHSARPQWAQMPTASELCVRHFIFSKVSPRIAETQFRNFFFRARNFGKLEMK
jgi:hypothetical protein